MDDQYLIAQKNLDDTKKEIKDMLTKSLRDLERVEDLSMKNFASWRDYLHKYFSVIFVLIGATGFLRSETFHLPYFKLGLWLALFGVFLGYIIINVYFYIERRWFQGGNLLSAEGVHNQFTHPQMETEDITEALLLHNRDFIEKLKEKIEKAKQEKNYAQIKYLKRMIKRNKKVALSFYFVGQHFELLERIWLIGISVSMLSTILGTILMFANIIT